MASFRLAADVFDMGNFGIIDNYIYRL